MTDRDLLHRFLHERSLTAPTIGPVALFCNPTSYRKTNAEPHATVTTLGSSGQWRYPGLPAIYSLQGHTSIAGMDGPGGLDQLRRALAPRQGIVGTVQPYAHPTQFRGIVMIRVNSFEESVQGGGDDYLLYQYTMELEESATVQAGPAVLISTTPTPAIGFTTTLGSRTSTSATTSPGRGLMIPRNLPQPS